MTDNELTQVEAFLARHPDYERPAAAASQCAIATVELVDFLAASGAAAQQVWVRSPTRPFHAAHPRALLADSHALVRLADDTLVDVTRRQFDPKALLPTIYRSEVELAADWKEINDDRWRNSEWRSLV